MPSQRNKMGANRNLRDSASCSGVGIDNTPFKLVENSEWTWEQKSRSFFPGQFDPYNTIKAVPPLTPLIWWNIAGYTLFCPLRNLVHPAPGINSSIDLRYSVDSLKAVLTSGKFPTPGPSSSSAMPVSWITDPLKDPTKDSITNRSKILGRVSCPLIPPSLKCTQQFCTLMEKASETEEVL